MKRKQKKLNYAGIPKSVLNMVIGESYGLGNYTLKNEIDSWGEDLICQRHYVKKYDDGEKRIEWLHAWTETKSMTLIYGGFGDQCLLAMDRTPPREILEEKERYERQQEDKRNQRRAKRSKRRK